MKGLRADADSAQGSIKGATGSTTQTSRHHFASLAWGMVSCSAQTSVRSELNVVAGVSPVAKILILQGSLASIQCLSVAQDCSEDAPGSRGFLKMWQSCLQKEASEGWPWPAKLLSICIGTEWCRRGAFPGPGLRHGRWPAAVPQASLPSVLSALSAFCAVAIFHCKKLRALVPRPIVQLGDYEDALEIRVPRPKHLVPRMQTCSRAGWPRNASRGKVCAPKYSFMVFKQNGLTTTKSPTGLAAYAGSSHGLPSELCLRTWAM